MSIQQCLDEWIIESEKIKLLIRQVALIKGYKDEYSEFRRIDFSIDELEKLSCFVTDSSAIIAQCEKGSMCICNYYLKNVYGSSILHCLDSSTQTKSMCIFDYLISEKKRWNDFIVHKERFMTNPLILKELLGLQCFNLKHSTVYYDTNYEYSFRDFDLSELRILHQG
jgi:hypothetical protein